MIKCSECGMAFPTKFALDEHARWEHGGPTVKGSVYAGRVSPYGDGRWRRPLPTIR